ncbi:N-acylneuraminate cytidylyltransferase [Aliiruegeria haliotis]|uniref:N-acylneuraminate cytidylyltransferase n=1 Tax=Aliiruegeria haliotis TaxID=1280846 RepID=A0A2T0RND4_9RHOB|nr:pseudaminic acid cytidylyltransferase [Aliiruegeria haliotis]PRY22704.1 N-acylneuraminate cytidylyltransferase [Aliiruegeria haliotis]
MKVAVIPARGGSKRIPRKNVATFHGRPMIGWSIAAARAAACFDRIVVSTDDDEIASIAEAEGAEVPFRRPAHLADDHAPTVPVVAQAAEALVLPPDTAVCCLYATAPFVRPEDLAEGARLLGRGASYAMAVTRFGYPIQRALRRGRDGSVEMIDPANMLVRSQDLEEAWHDAGQFYWARAATWTAGTPVFGPGAAGVALPAYRVQDIDTPEDWRRAEVLFGALEAGGWD